jgi:excisionase family DNA binding protein
MSLARALIEELGPDDLAELAERLAPYLPVPSADDPWLSTRDAAAYLGIPVSALHRLTAARTIPFFQEAPRARCFFKRSDLDRWRGATAS